MIIIIIIYNNNDNDNDNNNNNNNNVWGGGGVGCILFGWEDEIYKGPLQTQTIHYLTLIQSGQNFHRKLIVFIIYQRFVYYFYWFSCDSIRYLFGRRERWLLFFNAT